MQWDIHNIVIITIKLLQMNQILHLSTQKELIYC